MKKVFATVLITGLMVGGVTTAASAADAACWGQATKVFAATGDMGTHSAGQATPRVGLRNLARTLADAGIIPDDSMASLGVFVSGELGLDVDACM